MYFKYFLKTWLISVTLSPLLMIVWYNFTSTDGLQILSFYGWMLLYGGILSVPAVLILWVFAKMIAASTKLSSPIYKLILAGLVTVLIVLSFAALGLTHEYIVPLIAYLITTVLNIYIWHAVDKPGTEKLSP